MVYHPRIESSEYASFLTTRVRNSELWFVNNQKLEEAILGFAAKYSKRYTVKLYALSVEGNHVQGPAHFPEENRAAFMRDLNSSIARAVPRYAANYPGGRLWGRRYSSEFLPGEEDIEEYFFYTVLQPVQDGLVEKISDYPGYNCFHDAVNGIRRKFKVIRWFEYNEARRFGAKVSIKGFTDTVELSYERLPGYEHLSQKEYSKLMHTKLEERRIEIVRERSSRGVGFAGKEALLRTRPGSSPKRTKRSSVMSHRPRVLSVCHKRRAECRAWYFSIYFDYLEASKRYREGELLVDFPPGTYKPHVPAKAESPPG